MDRSTKGQTKGWAKEFTSILRNLESVSLVDNAEVNLFREDLFSADEDRVTPGLFSDLLCTQQIKAFHHFS